MCWDAAVVGGVVLPPFPADDGVRDEVRRDTLARTDQLFYWLAAAAGSVRNVSGGAQLSAAQV